MKCVEGNRKADYNQWVNSTNLMNLNYVCPCIFSLILIIILQNIDEYPCAHFKVEEAGSERKELVPDTQLINSTDRMQASLSKATVFYPTSYNLLNFLKKSIIEYNTKGKLFWCLGELDSFELISFFIMWFLVSRRITHNKMTLSN